MYESTTSELDELKAILERFNTEQESKKQRHHVKAVRKIIGILPAGAQREENGFRSMQNEVREKIPIRSPQLTDEYGLPILNLLMYRLPYNVNKNQILGLLHGNKISIESLKILPPKGRKTTSAIVTCSSLRDSLNLQILGCNEALRLGNNNYDKQQFVVRVVPCYNQGSTNHRVPNLPDSGNHKKFKVDHGIMPAVKPTTTHFVSMMSPRLGDLDEYLFGIIVEYLSFKEQFRLMSASKLLAEKVWRSPRNLIIDIDTDIRHALTTGEIHFFINPFNFKTCDDRLFPLFNKIILANKNICQNINGAIVKHLILPDSRTNSLLNELNMSAITISSKVVMDISNTCPNLKIFILGNTNGSCDHEIACLFSDEAKTKQIKVLGITNNNHLTGRMLDYPKFNTSIKITDLILRDCKKLHLQHINKFITSNNYISNFELQNCAHVQTSPRMDSIVNNLENTKLTKFELSSDEHYSAHYQFWNFDGIGIKNAENLREFKISGHWGIPRSIVTKVMSISPNLQKLEIQDCKLAKLEFPHNVETHLTTIVLGKIHDMGINFWKTHFQQLETLVIKNVKNISGLELNNFVLKNQNTLKVINLSKSTIRQPFWKLAELEYLPNINSKPPIQIVLKRGFRDYCRSTLKYRKRQEFPLAIFVEPTDTN